MVTAFSKGLPYSHGGCLSTVIASTGKLPLPEVNRGLAPVP
jgi:hypothetical protein